MLGQSKYSPRGFVYKDADLDPTIKNSLKKLNIFKSGSTIKPQCKTYVEQPKPILKSSAIPIWAVGASFKSNKTYTIDVWNKRFIPKDIVIEKGDTLKFVVNPSDEPRNKYVICVGDIDESNLLYPKDVFKTTFDQVGTYSIKCSINYEMKGSVDVVQPRPTLKEWESTVAPVANESPNNSKNVPGSVDSIANKSSTSIEAIKDRILNEQLKVALQKEEESFELDDEIKHNLTPVITNIKNKEKPKTDEENKREEAQEQQFLEQQRNSSMGSRAKSRSNKHTPESDKSRDVVISKESKWIRKLNLDEKMEKVRKFEFK